MTFHSPFLFLLPLGTLFLPRQALPFAGQPASPPVVDTAQGRVLGKYVSLEGLAQPVAVFLGVPFAKPPLGSLRFAPPQPAEPWSFVKNTTSYPPMCCQDPVVEQMTSDLFTNGKERLTLEFSEDCLYLNIYTPADLTKRGRLPVMVWIHGGGLVLGGAPMYDGVVLAAHENVVVVAIQYRLGIWGFFSTGDEHSRGNWGHLDQVAALHWVQENIANFGGDPGSVTIFGESAGGESVSVLVLSPLAKNLFHRAISESGVALTVALVRKDMKAAAKQIAVLAGCKTTTSAVFVHCLRQKSEDELLDLTLKMKFLTLDFHGDQRESHPFLPTVVDGVLLPKMPEEILAEKDFNTVPYIVGINKQEFGWLLPTMMGFPLSEGKLDQKTATSLLWKSYPIANIPEELTPVATDKYLGGTDDPVKKKDLFLDLMGDVVFGVPSVTVARQHRGESQTLDRRGTRIGSEVLSGTKKAELSEQDCVAPMVWRMLVSAAGLLPSQCELGLPAPSNLTQGCGGGGSGADESPGEEVSLWGALLRSSQDPSFSRSPPSPGLQARKRISAPELSL
uniref:Carboxylic ester hydrolase n=1 Tax=Sus scrofa TaxID=9823 RepID=A0A5G2QWJ0_PIG